MENRYRIELSESQIRLIANCLEDISRFAGGQMELRYTIEEMLKGIPFEEKMEKRALVESQLRNIKTVVFPDMPSNAYIGYDGTPFIGNVYQIYRTILHRLAIDNEWNNVYSSPALTSGDMGTISIEKI